MITEAYATQRQCLHCGHHHDPDDVRSISVGELACGECSRYSVAMSAEQLHDIYLTLVVRADLPFTCCECDFTDTTLIPLLRHLREAHPR